MDNQYVTEYVDGKYYLMIPINETRIDHDKAYTKANDVLNDLTSALRIAIKSDDLKDSPITRKAMERIDKSVWKIIQS